AHPTTVVNHAGSLHHPRRPYHTPPWRRRGPRCGPRPSFCLLVSPVSPPPGQPSAAARPALHPAHPPPPETSAPAGALSGGTTVSPAALSDGVAGAAAGARAAPPNSPRILSRT